MSNTDTQTPSNLAAYCWSTADLLRGDFKQSQYGRIILPFTLLRRLECILEETKDVVLAEYEKVQKMNLPEEDQEEILLCATKTYDNPSGLSFFNTSKMDLSKLGETGIKASLESYIQGFSKDAREIFEYFNFAEFVGQLNDCDLLYKMVRKVRKTDLSPQAISNHDMSLTFEELIRRFAEGSNETAGEHFTPRDIVRLTTALVLMEDDDALTKSGVIRTIYDPTAGTGGFLSSGIEYLHELNSLGIMKAFGQELNPESYAICKANMLIKGQEVNNIKLGHTLSNDQLYADKFDYMLSNPPLGVDWKKIEPIIREEHTLKGFDGRFGPGLPRVSDGSLLFLMHLVKKLRGSSEGGGRIGIILNGSPLFTGDAGSGESEIRRYLLENDLLESIVALPTDMFYNTGIATYVWIISNHKQAERKGKVQLINGVNLCGKMRKSLGSKRNEMSSDDITAITKTFGAFKVVDATTLDKLGLDKPGEEKSRGERQSSTPKVDAPRTFEAKIFDTHEFGYRRITIERPLRESYQFSDERLAKLRFANKPLNAPMKWIYETYGAEWSDADCQAPAAKKGKEYGQLVDLEDPIRKYVKVHFSELKEKNIKDLINSKTWNDQEKTLLKAQQLQSIIGKEQCDDMNTFESVLKNACQQLGIKLENKEKKQVLEAVSWKNPIAQKVIKKFHKTKANPIYGIFEVKLDGKNKVVEFQSDGDLRDIENIALDPCQSVNTLNEAYFMKEVQPHAPDAWIDANKKDDRDQGVGVVGYRISFSQLFYSSFEGESKQFTFVRCKEILDFNARGAYSLNLQNLKLERYSGDDSSVCARCSVDSTILNIEYFNYFVGTEEGINWLSSLKRGVTFSRLSQNDFLRSKISLPNIEYQRNIISLKRDHQALLEKLRIMESSLLLTPGQFEKQLVPHKNATQRYLDDFQHKLPHPLAILWNQANSKLTDKDACEAYCKFYEYLGVYLVSIAFGLIKAVDAKQFLTKGKETKSITMGFSYNRLEDCRRKFESCFPQGLKKIYSEEVVKLLKNATTIRNDISHRGLPSALDVKDTHRELESLNTKVQVLLYDFFTDYSMFMPISSKYDGEHFEYKVEQLDGLALNPSSTGRVISKEPLVDRQLYFGAIDNAEASDCYPIFPLVIMEETLIDSEFMAFYFYSDVVDKKMRYVCPYPNVSTYKFKEQNFWFNKA